jgi:hypothetical protein
MGNLRAPAASAAAAAAGSVGSHLSSIYIGGVPSELGAVKIIPREPQLSLVSGG